MTETARPQALDLKSELERGYAALGRGAYADADAVADAVLADSAGEGEGWRLRARVQLLRGDVAAARATLDAGVIAAKDPLPLLADLAEVAIKVEDGPAALKAALEVRRLGGEQVRWVLLTGKARWIAGEREAALADFALAAAHARDLASVQTTYARALLGMDRTAEGIAVLERAVARQPGGMASALLALATLDPAAPTARLPAVEAALALTPDEPTLKLLGAMLRALADRPVDVEAAIGGDAHQRARWEMFARLRQEGCTSWCGQPQQVVAAAYAAAAPDGAEVSFGTGSDVAALPAGQLRIARFDCRDAATTARALAALGERVAPGSVLVFDAYLGFPGAEQADFAAWRAFADARGIRHRYLAATLLGSTVAVLVEAIGAR
jgi:tetratricopeptide (TPR) repeat protein